MVSFEIYEKENSFAFKTHHSKSARGCRSEESKHKFYGFTKINRRNERAEHVSIYIYFKISFIIFSLNVFLTTFRKWKENRKKMLKTHMEEEKDVSTIIMHEAKNVWRCLFEVKGWSDCYLRIFLASHSIFSYFRSKSVSTCCRDWHFNLFIW